MGKKEYDLKYTVSERERERRNYFQTQTPRFMLAYNHNGNKVRRTIARLCLCLAKFYLLLLLCNKQDCPWLCKNGLSSFLFRQYISNQNICEIHFY